MLERKVNISYKNIILFIYVVVLTISGPFIFWLSDRKESTSNAQNPPEKVERVAEKNSKLLPFWSKSLLLINPNSQLKLGISTGEKILITDDNNLQKQAGIEAFKNRDYSKAIVLFQTALKIKRNDPETLIYLNNAIAAQQDKKITLATSVPIGGSLNVAQEILRGIAQAQQEINQKGGIQGYLIEIKIANDDNDPELARKIAAKFVADRDILAVIGHNSSEASLAAAPIYQKGKLIQISPTSVARELTSVGDYILRTTPSTRSIASTLAHHTMDVANHKKIAVCSDSQSPASKSFQEEFTLAIFEYGGEIAATKCDFAAPKFNPQAIPSQAISDGAEALLLIPDVNRIHQAIAVAQANEQRLTLLGNHTMYTFETLQQGQLDVNGMVLAVAWHPNLITDPNFLHQAQKLWGGVGTWRTASAYDATQVAIAGLNSGRSRQQLQQALTNPEFSFTGATGKVRFLPSGDRQGKIALVRVQPGNTSQTGFDFAYLDVE
jgi:branched-chain amino acid transport system substrate-binding protein